MAKPTKRPPTLDQRIRDLMNEGPLVALYLLVGINDLKSEIDSLGDDEVKAMFGNLLHPDKIRSNVDTIYNKLNFPQNEQ